MIWEMRYGRDGFAVRTQIARGQPPPEWYRKEPQLTDVGRWFLEAFDKLSTCRPIGEVPGPIPWTAIQAFAESRRMGAQSLATLETVIMALDSAYLRNQEIARPKMAKFGAKVIGNANG